MNPMVIIFRAMGTVAFASACYYSLTGQTWSYMAYISIAMYLNAILEHKD